MKLPAIRGKIGVWNYYVSTMSFRDVALYVKEINDELHKSTTLSKMIQRSITDNYKKIKSYILNQDERFFNSLVLAVYDGHPQWVEVEINYDDGEEFFNMGFLRLNGEEKIFPVDGQHRAEGIKRAIEEDESLSTQTVPVIFIGHSTDEEGMQRTRRLFSTLNRYAKPVSMRDIIALDEDDVVAIATRELLVDHPLFENDRVLDSKGKPIPDTNKLALTSVITLYDCNKELLKSFKTINNNKIALADYLRLRPSDEEIELFKQYVFEYWDEFVAHLTVIQEFVAMEGSSPAEPFRNRDNGGHLLFRPIGLLPFVIATLEICRRDNNSKINSVFNKFNTMNLRLNQKPWIRFLWNDHEKKVISGDNQLVKLLLMYMYDPDIIKENEKNSLVAKYIGKLGNVEEAQNILNQLSQSNTNS
ncbi:DNA sulfur modification protein DndB [Paenibacillus sp. FSL W7-1279]|uniref:DGQHR domain-containing protein n=1 Tax=Paenibacillus sp. FSL W7-1279 TaxID=2921697 RepID=UPI0030DDC774